MLLNTPLVPQGLFWEHITKSFESRRSKFSQRKNNDGTSFSERIIFCFYVLVPWKENWARKGTHPKAKYLVKWWAEDENRWVGPTSQGKGDKNCANLTPSFFILFCQLTFPGSSFWKLIMVLKKLCTIAAFLI